MAFRFKVDSRYRDCRSRFMLAQSFKNELTRPNGTYRWIVRARPNTLLHVYVMDNTFNIRAYDIPFGAILSPKGKHSPIKEFYRQSVTAQLEEYVRRSCSQYTNERACVFFVIEGEGDSRTVRELEFVEFHKEPEREAICLDLTVPLNETTFPISIYLK